MHSLYTLAATTCVLLEVIEALSRNTITFLPLGGSHTIQLAILLGLAYVVSEVREATR